MAGQSSNVFGLSLTDVSVLGSQVFGQALMDSCGRQVHQREEFKRGNYKWSPYSLEIMKCLSQFLF